MKMRVLVFGLLGIGLGAMFVPTVSAQRPGGAGQPPGGRGPGGERGAPQPPPPHPIVEGLDANKDGIISADEIKNAVESLKKLDKNQDGKLSEDELRPMLPGGGPGGRGTSGPAGPRGERGGPGGPAGPAGSGLGGGENRGRLTPGQVLPTPLKEQLKLSADQESQLNELESEVRGRLDKILTADQKRQLDEMRERGPVRPPEPNSPATQDPAAKPVGNEPPAPAEGGATGSIQWFTTLATALSEARRTNRPILFLTAAPHCSGVPGTW